MLEDTLITIAQTLSLKSLIAELNQVKAKSLSDDAELVLPLVGEFSAGKTTLVNALTDSKKLETATQPTTATIYEIHFGCDRCHATVVGENGEMREVEDIADLKNDKLTGSTVVNVFDTSTRIPATTVLVDTPGLSSPDPKHKQTLVDFLPQADGVLLVTDVNQQITRSLTDFIETMKLVKRPIFLVITKCDTKSSSELDAVRQYISENIQLPLKQIACVSVATGNLDELYNLLDSIQKDKANILKQVNAQRLKNISNRLLQHINELLQASSSDKGLDEAIRRQEYELKRLNQSINTLVESTREDINENSVQLSRQFEDIISEKLDVLVVGKSQNFDSDAISVINNTSSLLMNDFRNNIHGILRKKAKQQTENTIPLRSLEELDLSSLSISDISYNLDLNSIGHTYDSMIADGVKIVAAAIGAVAVVVGTAGTGGAAVAVGSAVDVADTVSDVGSIMSNNKTANRIEKAIDIASRTGDKLSSIDACNRRIGEQVGCQKGIVESLVGFVTDKGWGKPQRKRAIRQYMEDTLMPEFKQAMSRIEQQLVSSIQEVLHREAYETIQEKTASLEQLREERKAQKDDYEKRMTLLRDYKNQLLTL
ncbi:dynamin family protein [Parabacteroides sp. ZJ-118]|uniref:dynamin family protein n=1 Tax=Parabacteroides sp. ZJ-118 TaxID=2709398 RepID=UPI0013EDD127|nr:dynamin family protein [Parabacteroides sp. ZJ-118]